MTGIVGALVEAWDELRIHRLRVLLSLIGVAAAVTAITGITAAVEMLNQGMREQSERSGGRDMTLSVNIYAQGQASQDATAITAAFGTITERYGIDYSSRTTWGQVDARLPGGTREIQAQLVDPAYGIIHRSQTIDGRWFTEADSTRYAPVAVVNEAMMRELGAGPVAGHPTMVLVGATPVRAEIVGVVGDQWDGEEPAATLLYDQAVRWELPKSTWGAPVPSLEIWVPHDTRRELTDAIPRDVASTMPGMTADVYEMSGTWGALDGATRWVVLGVSAFALLLGGLGLVNIALVTVRHRIREIGIRRSFGATSGRVFFSVLMESVVATVVAGAVGVAIAVAIVKNIPVERVMGFPIDDMPPFPLSSALIGMACAAGIGALAGLLPAIVAVRVKVIDAIRY